MNGDRSKLLQIIPQMILVLSNGDSFTMFNILHVTSICRSTSSIIDIKTVLDNPGAVEVTTIPATGNIDAGVEGIANGYDTAGDNFKTLKMWNY